MTNDKKQSLKKSSDRTRARDHKKKRRQQRSQQRRLILGGVAIVVVLAIIATFIIVNLPASAPIPDGTFERYQTFELEKTLPQNITEEGFPYLGNPNAPVRVKVYSSFTSTDAAQFHEESMDTLLELVKEGIIAYYFIPVSLGGTNPEGASRAALCAGEQGLFFEFHDALFHWIKEFGGKAFSQNRLASGIEELPAIDQDEYDQCIGSDYANDVIDAAQREFNQLELGLPQLPQISINGTLFTAELTIDELVTEINRVWAETGLDAVSPGGGDAAPAPTMERTPPVEVSPEVEMTVTPEVTPMTETTPTATAEATESIE